MIRNFKQLTKCPHRHIKEIVEGDLEHDEDKDYLICLDCGFLYDREFQFRKFVFENQQHLTQEKLKKLIKESGLKATDGMLRDLENDGLFCIGEDD
jgi:hypothetical protein